VKPFEIFRPGTHTPMTGEPITFSEDVVKAIAAAYDPARHEAPVVIGHPKDDAPAWGWVKGLEFRDGALIAELDQVEPAFAELVEAGRFKKVSASFYPAGHPSNPTPGQLALRHVGVLGAVAPSLKGLKPISFAGDEAEILTFEFGEGDWQMSWVFGAIGRALQAMRELVIADRGEEAADKAIPKYDIEEVHRAAGAMQERARKSESPAFAEQPVQPERKEPPMPKELETREAEIAAREKKLADDALAFAEKQKVARRDAGKAALDQLVAEGKLAAGYAGPVLDFMESLEAAETLDFGEGDAKQTATPRDFFLDLLRKGGTVIDFSERAAAGEEAADTLDFAAPDGATVDPSRMDLHRKAVAHQKANPNTTYVDALRAVGVN